MQSQALPVNWSFLRTLLLAWLFAAVALARFGLLGRDFPVAQVILVVTGGLFGWAAFRLAPVRNPLWNCDIRWLVLLHLSRFVGFWFLVLYARKRLPYDFAVKGGWGDIVAAALACVVLLIPAGVSFRPLAIQVWNVFGLVDILFVVGTAARLTLADRHVMDELRHIPMSLLPTFLVPLIIVTHVVIWARVRQGKL